MNLQNRSRVIPRVRIGQLFFNLFKPLHFVGCDIFLPKEFPVGFFRDASDDNQSGLNRCASESIEPVVTERLLLVLFKVICIVNSRRESSVNHGWYWQLLGILTPLR